MGRPDRLRQGYGESAEAFAKAEGLPLPEIRYRAAWVLPISEPPIRNGAVTIRGEDVLDVGVAEASDVDLGNVAILPGLVNAHTHLELSWMRGRVPRSSQMPAWAREVIRQRREAGEDDPRAIVAAVREARESGTALVGDISNNLASVSALADSPLGGVVFLELLKFNPEDAAQIARSARDRIDALRLPPRLRLALAAHAPYSVAPSLFAAVRDSSPDDGPYSIHVGESQEEIAFLQTGEGLWRDLLQEVGAWNPAWTPPRTGPVGYLEDLGVLSPRLLAAHGVQLADGELATLGRYGSTLVTCPRSNAWTGAGDPPVGRFYKSGVRVAIGTDSLASVPDLNMFAEMAAVRALAPGVPAARILHSATRAGAEALGFSRRCGAIEAGKSGDLLTIAVPPGLDDVEEYLVSGIAPGQVRWLRDGQPTTC